MDFGPDGRYSLPTKSWDLSTLKGIVDDWQSFMVSHNGSVLGSSISVLEINDGWQDGTRSASRATTSRAA